MTQRERAIVVGVFDSQQQAQQAVDALRQSGFTDQQIGFAVRGGEGPQGIATTPTTDRPGGTADVAGGAVAGGVIGALVGAGAALLIPGVGPAVAGGILASALTGGAVGVVAGGLLGALVGLGVPENEARYYQSEFEAGRVIVTVQVGKRQQEALDILHRYGAYNAQTRPANTGPRWEEAAPRYRTTWQQQAGTKGQRWEDVEPAYRYGTALAASPYYRGRKWAEVEPEIRRDWEHRFPNKPWDQARACIYEAAVTGTPATTATRATTS